MACSNARKYDHKSVVPGLLCGSCCSRYKKWDCICVFLCTSTSQHTHTHTHIRTHMYMHMCTQTHNHTHTCICARHTCLWVRVTLVAANKASESYLFLESMDSNLRSCVHTHVFTMQWYGVGTYLHQAASIHLLLLNKKSAEGGGETTSFAGITCLDTKRTLTNTGVVKDKTKTCLLCGL